jgi:hypothetical protein
MATVSVNPPKTPVTKGSNGIAAATVPNICKMPGPPAPFVPTPLPNIGKSGNSPDGYSKNVKFEGKEIAIKGATFKSMGDVASKGTGGGMVSANTEGPTKFVGPGSMDVKVEGKNVQLLSDPMLNNCGGGGSPPNAATVLGLLQDSIMVAIVGDEHCALCENEHGDDGKLEETPDTKNDANTLKKAADDAVKAAIRKRPAAEQAEIEKAERERAETSKTIHIRQVPQAQLNTMLGVVRCKCGKTFAGKSGPQFKELQDAMPNGWHSPFTKQSIIDFRKKLEPDEHLNKFLLVISPNKQPAFTEAWHNVSDAISNRYKGINITCNGAGSCAAQQLILLALSHGCRPVSLTERKYKTKKETNEEDANVQMYYRERTNGEPKSGNFSGENSVPPCGSCEIILPMLLCPEDKPKECVKKEINKEECLCKITE